ncbi:DUF4238 domain-containing protein [Vibrio fortis]|uniref:DUF4238 domain-containing protein n=1 Tax=Vibrio fortis TaxID=212667 RepID=A0A5N3QX87_9VIBR|nr:DUF4238 domain-containing protein [Vibrio fortis]KAB0286806.1 DUF4238 domain-containing protein [Vibrio fortis]
MNRPRREKQHFVPRFYLSNFTNYNDSIGMFNLLTKKYIEDASLYNQCQKKYFYGKSEEIEDALGEVEAKCSAIILNIIKNPDLKKLSREDRIPLMLFICLQQNRTNWSSEVTEDNYIEMIKKTAEFSGSVTDDELKNIELKLSEAIKIPLEHAVKSFPLLLDLKIKILESNSKSKFITSDHPVVSLNPLMQGYESSGFPIGVVGMQSKGLVLLLPISSKFTLVAYDSIAYFFGKNEKNIITLNESDTNEINRAIISNAQKNIYFDKSISQDYIKTLCDKVNNKYYSGKNNVSLNRIDANKAILTTKPTLKVDNLLLSKRTLVVRQNAKDSIKEILLRNTNVDSMIRSTKLLKDYDEFYQNFSDEFATGFELIDYIRKKRFS